MLKLLKFEFHKLIRQKSTYICILIPFIFLFLEILINKLIYMNDNAQIPTTINILKTSLATTNLTLILAIFIAINVTEDYTEQTIKNIYGKGYSRESVYLTKYIIIILYTLINVIIIYLSSLLIGNIFFELGNIDNLIINLISPAIIILVYSSLSYLIAVSFKKTGPAIACSILIPLIISLLVNTLDSVLKLENIKLANYWLDSFLTNINNNNNNSNISIIIMAIIYTFIFFVSGLIINKKQTI